MRRAIVLAVFAWLATCVSPLDAWAQRPAQRRREPVRVDPLTASISGKITTSDTGAPIRGAEVRLSIDGRYSRLATTDGDGRYELRDLPAGEYTLVVSRTGFTTLSYGQRRPFEAATRIALTEGGSAEADVALIRGGVIYGHLLDQYGEPLAGTRVQVLRSRVVRGQRRLQSVGAADQTDDTGAFRIYGLPPGDYYVAAAAGMGDQVKRDPPTYYPGTANFASAQTIAINAGQEASADFQIADIRNARVTGIVVNASGNPVAAMVNLTSETVSSGPGLDGGPAPFQIHADARADGTFSLENVPPGPYSLTAMVMPGPVGPDVFGTSNGPQTPGEMMRRMPEQVATQLVVNGDDVSGITLVTRAGSVLNGSFVADYGVTTPLPRGLRISPRSTTMGVAMTMGNGSGGEFQLVGLVGPFTFNVQGIPDGWTVKSILLDGRDISDELVDMRGSESTLRVVMSDRASSVVGNVQSRSDSVDYNVVVFPEDPTKWTYPSRYIKTARTDAQGRFRIADLPGGERYMAAAIDYLEDGEQDDAQFLERLRARATSFALSEGQQRSLLLDPIAR